MVVALIYTLLFSFLPLSTGAGNSSSSGITLQQNLCPERPPLVPIRKGNLFGLVDRAGKIVVPIRYKQIRIQGNGTIAMEDKSGVQLLSATGQAIGRFPNMKAVTDQEYRAYIKVPEKGKFRLTDTLGTVLTPAKYDEIEPFKCLWEIKHYKCNWAVVSFKRKATLGLKSRKGLINRQGQEVVPVKYDAVSTFLYGYAQVSLKGRKGAVDLQGREFWVPDQYRSPEFSFTFQPGFWVWQQNFGKKGALDYSGNTLLPNEYREIERQYEYIRVAGDSERGKGYGLLDTAFREILPPEYGNINFNTYPFVVVDNYNREEKRLKKGLVFNGRLVLAPVYDDIIPYRNDHYIMAGAEGNWHVFGLDGEKLFSVPADKLLYFGNGLFRVNLQNKYGLVDSTGKAVFPTEYTYIGLHWSDYGCAQICKDGLCGLLDKYGKLFVPMEYNNIDCRMLAGIRVKKGNKYGLLDSKGKPWVPVEYDKLYPLSATRYSGRRNGKPFVMIDGKLTELEDEGAKVTPYDLNLWLQSAYIPDRPYSGNQTGPHPRAFTFTYYLFDPETGTKSPTGFERAGELYNGVMWVQSGSRYALLSANGHFLTDFKFTTKSEFRRGVAWVETGGIGYYIDCSGKEYILD